MLLVHRVCTPVRLSVATPSVITMTTTEQRWEPLAPGALGADPTEGDPRDALLPDLPPLPLTGPLAEALTLSRTALDAAQSASHHTATLTPDQRLDALRQVAAARHVADAVLLRLTSTFTPEDLRTLGATTVVDLLLTHTGADPTRAATEAKLAAVLTAPPLTPPPPVEEPTLDGDGRDGDDEVAALAGPVAGPAAGPVAGPAQQPAPLQDPAQVAPPSPWAPWACATPPGRSPPTSPPWRRAPWPACPPASAAPAAPPPTPPWPSCCPA